MQLYLLRHAVAQERAESDAARELTPEGIAQARAVTEKFREYAPAMDSVVCSPYRRAQQTAAVVMPLFPDIKMKIDDAIRPEGDVYAAMHSIDGSAAENIMLVGHNPFMSKLLSLLVDGAIESHHYVGNASLYCVSLDVVAPGCGKIMYTLNP